MKKIHKLGPARRLALKYLEAKGIIFKHPPKYKDAALALLELGVDLQVKRETNYHLKKGLSLWYQKNSPSDNFEIGGKSMKKRLVKNSASSGKRHAQIKVFDGNGNLKQIIPEKSGVNCGWNANFNNPQRNIR